MAFIPVQLRLPLMRHPVTLITMPIPASYDYYYIIIIFSDYQVDLGYCIDRHQSISVPEWSQMLQFISNFSIYANIESSGSRVGLVSFDEISTMDIRLDKHDNVFDLQTDILSQVHSGQGRDISVGIYRLRVDLFQKDNGK